jgi:hypothetical protein
VGKPDLAVIGVIGMRVILLFTALSIAFCSYGAASAAEAGAAAPEVSLSFPHVTMHQGEERSVDFDLRWPGVHENIAVEARFDASAVASLVTVGIGPSDGCLLDANVVTCRGTMTVPGDHIAFVVLNAHGRTGTGQITITATVQGQALDLK